MIADLMRRKKEYDEKREIRKRRARLIVAVLSALVIVASVCVTAIVAASTKAPAPAEQTTDQTETETDAGIGSDPTTDTARSVNETENTGVYAETSEDTEKKLETDKPDISASVGFSGDKNDLIQLSIKTHGNRSWLTDKVKNDYDLSDYGYNPFTNKSIYYGKQETGDIFELEITVKNNSKTKESIMIYIEADDAEIISENIIKTEIPGSSSPDDAICISVPVRYRYTDGRSLANLRYIVFKSEKAIAEAEKFINDGNSVFTNGFDVTVNDDLHGWLFYTQISVFRVKDASFLCYISYDLQYMYEMTAIYFGDVDDNGVPLFITNPDMPDYKECPWCKVKREASKSFSLDRCLILNNSKKNFKGGIIQLV